MYYLLKKLIFILWIPNGFECINFKNSNLCKYVSKFCDKNFVEEYFELSTEWHVYHIFWIRGCKKFNHSRLLFSCKRASKVDKILWKLNILWIPNWFECINFKNSNPCKYVSKCCDKNFVEEYFAVSTKWHVYHIFWIHGC